MKRKIAIIGVTSLMAAGAGLLIGHSLKAQAEPRDTRIIVELDSSYNKKSETGTKSQQNIVLNRIRDEVTSNIRVVDRFVNVVNAFTLDVNAKHVSAIRNIPGVNKVEYDVERYVTFKEPDLAREFSIVSETTSNISKETMNIPDDTKEGENTLIAILDTSFMINATYKETGDDGETIEWKNVSHKAFTALDESVSVRYTQESLKSVIDASTTFHGKYDETHSTYFNNKVPFYYDYGGAISITPKDTDISAGEEDYDVFALDEDHGNHVATIAAGNDPLYKGIAPKAQLALMKVFTEITRTLEDGTVTNSTSAFDTSLLKAFEDCAVIKPDVINMSLGSDLNDFMQDEILKDAVTNLKKLGCLCSISAGNAGREQFAETPYEYSTTDLVDTGIIGNETLYDEAMIIASGEPNKNYYDTALKVGDSIIAFHDQIYNSDPSDPDYTTELRLTDLLDGELTKKFNWVLVPNWGEAEDFAEITKDDPDFVKGKIAICYRGGEVPFTTKITNAQKYGAIAVGIIDNDMTATDFNFRMDLGGMQPKVPVFSILYRDKATFEKADKAKIDECYLLSNVIENNPLAKGVSDFTSDGASYNLRLVPDIMTPGTNILGGVYAGGPSAYDYYSGTSMAAPNFSGVYALMISEHIDNATWRNSIEDRLMSTATPSLDKYAKNPVTPRRQGAGMVDVSKALATDVILDGSNSIDNLKGKAKIELLNNDKIKEGKIDLSFVSVSESVEPITYKATLSIYKPGTGNLDPERFGEIYDGVTLASNVDELIDTKDFDITVNNGTQVHNLTYDLSAEQKAAIDAVFPVGCYLEGFVTLKAESVTTLSIPYMGFYGNHDDAIPVEPFKFERDNSKVYQSDIVNSLLNKYAGKTYANYSSDWYLGNWADLGDLDLTDYVLNDKGLNNILDDNRNPMVQAGINPYTGKFETQDIYMGNNGFTNTMIIQQFVMRSVDDNVLTITNKATGEVVLTDHMFDALYGAVEDDDGNDIQWPLYKSFISPTYWGTYFAHRAYTIIPLYEYEYDEEKEKYINGEKFADGEYEIKFEYSLAQGGTFEKKYTLHIDSEAPQIKSVESLQKDGEDYLRIRYEELKYSYVAISGVRHEIQKDENGYYVDIKVSEYAEKNKAFFKAYDFAGGISTTLMKIDDPNHITVTSKTISNAYDFTSNINDIDGKSFSLSLSYVKGNKEAKLEEDARFTMNLSKFVVEGSDFAPTVAILVNGESKACDFSYDSASKTISFYGKTNDTFVINYRSEAAPVDPEPEPEPGQVDPEPEPGGDEKKSGGCGGSIVASSILISTMSFAALGLIIARRKKQD